jgi:hypothetical protein
MVHRKEFFMNEVLKKIKRFLFKDKYKVRNRLFELDQYMDKAEHSIENLMRCIVLNYLTLESKMEESIDPEKQEVIDFLTNNSLSVFPYDFSKKYNAQDINVYDDKENKMKYVLHNGKKMYFPRGWKQINIQRYYNGLLIEQDAESPHCYETCKFQIENGDIAADIGAAEGIFGLSNIEKIKKLYLFECDEKWIEALRQTFMPWKEKVEITNKYISDKTYENFITIDNFIGKKEINFIKADIEGAEIELLTGANKTLSMQKNLKLVLCAYHRQNDAQDLKRILEEKGFSTEFSKGYMIFIWDKFLSPPYLRKGLIRAQRQ